LILARIALLTGLFIAPAVLLVLGHRMRERSDRSKRMFWGGVIGHSIGLAIAMLVMMTPPVWWADTESARTFTVHWSMLVGFGAGALIAPVLPRGR
jgi:L-cystine uptake protein TcyP (sodium:dicarboxylate symporter family)